MSASAETLMRVEAIRVPQYRTSYGSCLDLAKSIDEEGLRHPITVWSDGTLISGGRRVRAHMLGQKSRIPAVFVSTIEEAAKRLLADNEDDRLALPMKWTEICRLWKRMRELDAPAAAQRADEARRRGVHLRRETLAGKRRPGRSSSHTEDYALNVIREPWGISYATARRVETIYDIAHGDNADAHQELAVEVLKDLDAGAAIWPCYQRILAARPEGPRPSVRRSPPPAAPAMQTSASRQVAAWERALPLIEGALAGLTELGAPHPDLTWDVVGPVFSRLTVSRRAMEKLIKQMRESNKS